MEFQAESLTIEADRANELLNDVLEELLEKQTEQFDDDTTLNLLNSPVSGSKKRSASYTAYSALMVSISAAAALTTLYCLKKKKASEFEDEDFHRI